jgi:2-C-methyl-D-erythritol 4-phosphate cytidylyltransferase
MYNGKIVCAVVAAGGSGSRFGSPKQLAPLAGKPVIAWSAGLIQENGLVDFAVMVMNGGLLARWEAIADEYGLDKFSAVPGESGRQGSVLAGIKRAAEYAAGRDALIVVHDGARPLASRESLEEAIAAADEYGGAAVSVPVSETVKAAENGFVVNTPDRDTLYIAQTPQSFRLSLLLRAHEEALRRGFTGPDDASLVERAGGRVKIVPGSNKNIKITFQGDLSIAEAYIRADSARPVKGDK